MAGTSWKISGEYMETCNCDYVCPCTPTSLAGVPTQGYCYAAMAFHIDDGHYGELQLDDLTFVVVIDSPGAMGEGNWKVGLLMDERASEAQQEAIVGIATGQAGGPMAALGSLVGEFAGIERAAISYERNGNTRIVAAPNLLDQTAEGVVGNDPQEAIHIDHTVHPVNSRLALAQSKGSHFHMFGMEYDSDGGNNGHYAPFNWAGEG
jgi:hypothetical protein